jgi:hypothetical protein
VDLLQKSISVASNLFVCLCLVSMFLPHIVEYFGLKCGTYVFFFFGGFVKDSFAPQDRV